MQMALRAPDMPVKPTPFPRDVNLYIQMKTFTLPIQDASGSNPRRAAGAAMKARLLEQLRSNLDVEAIEGSWGSDLEEFGRARAGVLLY